MSEDEIITLVASAQFHDSALTEWILAGEDAPAHCVMGQRNIDLLPLPTSQDGLCLYHHERGDGSGMLGKRDFPVAAEIISIADAHDTGAPLTGFSAELVKLLEEVLAAESEPLPQWHLPPQAAMKLGELIGQAIDYKSKFTRRHTAGLAEKTLKMAAFYGYEAEETAKLYLAACMHDLGKLATPSAILEKPGRLNDAEFQIIKDHVSHTHWLLEGVDDDIRHWASAHHEKLDGSGYPLGLTADKLDFNAKLMTCLDIYQAVSEERPYHGARSHAETMPIMNKMAEIGVICGDIVRDTDKVLAD
jgi:HD-GYP domain-containing protein (c-di-GMP phosphodiesterase class II)